MEQDKAEITSELLELSAEIVSAYVSHNVVPSTELPYIQVHAPVITSNDCEGAGETFLIQVEQTCTVFSLF